MPQDLLNTPVMPSWSQSPFGSCAIRDPPARPADRARANPGTDTQCHLEQPSIEVMSGGQNWGYHNEKKITLEKGFSAVVTACADNKEKDK